MINLNTNPQQLMNELQEDRKKAVYWLVKKSGGQKGYTRLQDKLLLDARKNRHDVASDSYEYLSPNGNRWMVYECAQYIKETNAAMTRTIAFCFYETVGGIGAYIPLNLGISSSGGSQGCLIFTSHFFCRFSERAEVERFDADMLQRFINALFNFTINLYKKEGEVRVDIKLSGGIARGIRRKGQENIFEIRTFLKDAQLSNSQKRHTANLHDSVGEGLYIPDEARADRIQQSENHEQAFNQEMQDMKTLFCQQGGDPEQFDNMMKVGVWLPNVWIRMGYADLLNKEFLQRHALVNRNIINDFTAKGCPKDEFADLVEACSRNMKLKSFDRQKAEAVITEYFNELDIFHKS